MNKKLNLFLIIFFTIILICACFCLLAELYGVDIPDEPVKTKISKEWNPSNAYDYYKLNVSTDIPAGKYIIKHNNGNSPNDKIFNIYISKINYTEQNDILYNIPMDDYIGILGGYGNNTSYVLNLEEGQYLYVIYSHGNSGKLILESI